MYIKKFQIIRFVESIWELVGKLEKTKSAARAKGAEKIPVKKYLIKDKFQPYKMS